MNEVAFSIMVAIDACEDRRYKEAEQVLAEVPMVLVRTRDAGVHFGYLRFIANAQHGCFRIVLADSRRIWNWTGANTLNEIAAKGIASGRVSDKITINIIPQVIEVIPCEPAAAENLSKAKW